jgi:predicted unusual protein kinase regulating ubiquinone biosynthesis (AarF/ABC1/UbiB family)
MILPGNVVGYVDFGITGTISEYSRQSLIGLTLAYTSGDLKGMGKAFFRVSTMDSETSEVRFQRGLERDARSWYEKDGREVRLRKNFTLVMLDMLRLSRETGVWPERDVIKYIRSAIAIDGLITRFAPTFDVGQHLRTTCDRYLKLNLRRRLFSMSNLIGWSTASGNLVRDGGVRALEALSRLADLSASDYPNAVSSGPMSGPAASRVAYIAGFICTICFAAVRSPRELEFGTNLFTAEVVLAGIAFAWLINSVRKIPQRG